VQDVPVIFGHELLVQTMNDPDCVGCAVHGGYNGFGDVREVEFKVKVEVDAEVGPEVTEAEVVAVVGRGSTAAHTEEIVSRAVLTRSAAHDISKHELAKGLNV
jgi:hypothetical protein